MATYISTIKGIGYYYYSDTIYINKGKSSKFNFSLGPVKKQDSGQILKKKLECQDRLIQQEIKARTDYWQQLSDNKTIFSQETILELEKLRSKLVHSKEQLGDFGKVALDGAFFVDFVYNSNKIEGSELPRKEVQLLLKNVKANNEVANTENARYFINEKFKFTIPSLINAHKQLLAHEPANHGLRKTTIIVGNDSTLSKPEDVRRKLTELFDWVQSSRHKLYPPELAFKFYYMFERIHPFADGNGRLGRLIMNHILRTQKYHPIIVWNTNRAAHFTAFERTSKDNHMNPFYRFMIEQYAKTYEIYLKRIEDAIKLQKSYDAFLSPTE